jgi:hypothetical protein
MKKQEEAPFCVRLSLESIVVVVGAGGGEGTV